MIGLLSTLINNSLEDDAYIIGSFIYPLVRSQNSSFSKAEQAALCYNMGTILLRWKSPENAARYFDEAKNLASTCPTGETSDSYYKPDCSIGNLESDIHWQLYQCYKDQERWGECLGQLNNIPPEKRNSAVHLAMGEIYQHLGDMQLTKTVLYHVLRDLPYSLRTARTLIRHHSPPEEVWKQMLMSLLKASGDTLWGTEAVTPELLRSQLHILLEAVLNLWHRAPNYSQVIDNLTKLQAFQNDITLSGQKNAALLCYLGEAYFLSGDYANARLTLSLLHETHRDWIKHMDILAYLLYRQKSSSQPATTTHKKKCQELINLALYLYHHFPERLETYIAQAYVNLLSGQHSVVQDCITKVMGMDKSNPQIYLLRGQALQAQDKHMEALLVYTEYRQYEQYNMEILEDWVEVCMKKRLYSDVCLKLNDIISTLPFSPRLFLLLGNVHMAEVPASQQARTCFEHVLKSQPDNVDAIVNLALSHFYAHQDTKAINVIEEGLKIRKHYRLYMELANIYARRRLMTLAMTTMNTALQLEPNNEIVVERAKELEEQISSSNIMFIDEESIDANGNWSD